MQIAAELAALGHLNERGEPYRRERLVRDHVAPDRSLGHMTGTGGGS
jgi:hypothetical protein